MLYTFRHHKINNSHDPTNNCNLAGTHTLSRPDTNRIVTTTTTRTGPHWVTSTPIAAARRVPALRLHSDDAAVLVVWPKIGPCGGGNIEHIGATSRLFCRLLVRQPWLLAHRIQHVLQRDALLRPPIYLLLYVQRILTPRGVDVVSCSVSAGLGPLLWLLRANPVQPSRHLVP